MKHSIGLLALVGLLGGSSVATAQINTPPSVDLPLQYDSGWVENTQEGDAPIVVASLPVYATGADWMRVFFDDVVLSGSIEAGNASFLRITSMLDGEQQTLNAEHVEQWYKSTAYFNGDAVLIELLAFPNTGQNRFALQKAVTGLPPISTESQCGGTDDRVPSNDPRAARILPIGCTGWIINDACGCFLTAGHCSGGSSIVQFNVPLSNPNGSLNNPSPSDQYSVDVSSRQSNGGQGIGNDYAYFGVFPNSNTGLTPVQAQGSSYVIVNPPAFQSTQQIRITGYGVDGGTRNQTEQTDVGPRINTPLATEVEYQVDTQGGNSGSPVIWEQTGQAIGIHTHAGCGVSTGNHGTGINHPGLQTFLANPKGVCFKQVCGVTATTSLSNGSGINPVCLTSLTPPIIGTNWMIQVDASGTPGATSTFVQGRRGGTSGIFLGIGEVLIDLSTNLVFASEAGGGGVNVHVIAVPNVLTIVGLDVFIQGGVVAGGTISQLCNGEMATVGCQ